MTVQRTTEQGGHDHCPSCSHCIPIHGETVAAEGFPCGMCPSGVCVPDAVDLSVLRVMVFKDNLRAAIIQCGV